MSRFNPDNASPSAYANFADCPKKFWIFRLHPKSSEFRNKGKSVGSVVDQTLHRFFQRPPENRDLSALRAEFDLTWLIEKDNVKDWCILPSEEELCQKDAWQVLEAFFKNYDVSKTPLYIPPLNNNEAKFDLLIKLNLAPDLLVQGWGDRLDEVPGGYEVIDYKTKTGAELYEEKNNLQLRMYGILFDEWLKRKGLTGKITKLSFLYLTPRGVEKREFSFSESDQTQTITEIKSIQQKIRKYWSEYGENPWPCSCGTCSNLLAKMEQRADEWARGINSPVQTTLPVTPDIPF